MILATSDSMESSFHAIVWISSVAAAVITVFNESQRRAGFLHDLGYLQEGWFGLRRDVSDPDWNEWQSDFFSIIPFLVSHVCISSAVKIHCKKILSISHFLVGICFLHSKLGWPGIGYLLAQPLAFFALLRVTNRAIIFYAMSIAFMLSIQGFPSYHQYLSWINLRCLSYCLDITWRRVSCSKSISCELPKLLGYCFYLPLTNGPIVNFKQYSDGLESDFDASPVRIINSLLTLARYIFWMFINNVLLHFVYVNALALDFVSVLNASGDGNLMTVLGIPFCLGLFFYMKYVVFYGIPRAFLLLDGIEPPVATKCVCRIHLYSDMWRYFDNGLYTFLHEYFFQPIRLFLSNNVGSRTVSQLVASSLTFCFIGLWHAQEPNVITWCALNFAGVTLERFVRRTVSSLGFTSPPSRGRCRLHCLLSAPLSAMSMLSQFYFLMDADAADVVVVKACLSWPLGTPAIFFAVYCFCQTSAEVNDRETDVCERSIK